MLVFYCLGSLDLLGLLREKSTETERETWRQWIWEQQTRLLFYPSHSMLFLLTSGRGRRTVWFGIQAKFLHDFTRRLRRIGLSAYCSFPAWISQRSIHPLGGKFGIQPAASDRDVYCLAFPRDIARRF